MCAARQPFRGRLPYVYIRVTYRSESGPRKGFKLTLFITIIIIIICYLSLYLFIIFLTVPSYISLLFLSLLFYFLFVLLLYRHFLPIFYVFRSYIKKKCEMEVLFIIICNATVRRLSGMVRKRRKRSSGVFVKRRAYNRGAKQTRDRGTYKRDGRYRKLE